MRFKILEVLDQLSKLDRSLYSYDETKRLIGQLGKFGCILVTLHQGKTLMRARPNYNNERFTSKSEFIYKPQKFNITYQRASTPQRTMFYASMIPDTIQPGELNNTRVIGAVEALPWLRDKTTKGYQMISYGRWLVTKDIKLIAVVQHDSFYKESSYTRELAESFNKQTKLYPELQDETIAISDFFAKEFAKAETNHDYDYLLSAAFTETVVDKGLDGILYPSVRVGGQGFNVAIKPEIADTNLELVVVGECSIYKYNDRVIVDNETNLELQPGQINFKLLPIDPLYHAGEAECLRRLGINSMKELTD